METQWRDWLVVGVLLATTAYVVAEEISLTTYYPSPKGAYQTLSSTSTSAFAIYEGGVGIGTRAAAPGTKLAVAGTPAVDPAGGTCPPGTDWYDENGNGAPDAGECKPTALAATAGGKVGIGTASPFGKFDVSAPNTGLVIGSNALVNLVNTQAADTANLRAGINLRFANGISNSNSYIEAINETGGATSIAFAPATGGNGTERVRITSSGNVGIGTTEPGDLLTVAGIISSDRNYSGSAGSYFRLFRQGLEKMRLGLDISDNFAIMDTGDSPKVSVTSGGNVGIGGGPLTQKLYVAGDIIIPAANKYTWIAPANHNPGDQPYLKTVGGGTCPNVTDVRVVYNTADDVSLCFGYQ